MRSPGSNKGLLLLIGLLLITNLTMLWYFTRPAKEEKVKSRSERMAAWIGRELKWDDEQVKQYLQLRQRRDSILAPLNLKMRTAKLEMIDLLKQPNIADSVIKATADKVAANQTQLEIENYYHFKRVQAICTPNQLPSFDSMLVKMVYRNTGDTTQTRGN